MTIAWGEIAYEGYREHSHGKSLVSGSPIPPWDELPVNIQEAWEESARCVRQTCVNLIDQTYDEPINEMQE